ncbi:unnamed protein product [marine sediment metagenome]|uniref:Uncharacterized protein n=1 Tax=marine sediment metagenome TaxID=412755 RepID=X0VJE7_9ZZZZ
MTIEQDDMLLTPEAKVAIAISCHIFQDRLGEKIHLADKIAEAQLAELLKHRLDRPDREKIVRVLTELFGEYKDMSWRADQILALFPDIEEAREQLRVQVPNLIAEAKEQEKERICNEVERYFKYLKDEKPPIMIADTFELKAWWQALKEGK